MDIKDINLNLIRKIPVKYKVMALSGVLVITAGVYWWYSYNPKVVYMTGRIEELKKQMADLKEKKRKVANIDKYKEYVSQMNERFVKSLQELPGKKEMPSLLSTISSSGAEAGLEFLTFKPGVEKQQELYASVDISLSVKGSYQQIATFFDKMANLPRIVRISNVEIGSPKEVDGKVELTSNLVATAYRNIEGKK